MKQKTIEWVDEFDMTAARYDRLKEFYVEYRRVTGNATSETDLRAIKNALRGDVRANTGSYWGGDPVVHLPNGTVLLQMCALNNPECRGRYTFGGHDFTVVSSTNDGVFAKAAPFIRYKEALDFHQVRLSATAFNKLPNGGTSSQTLLIDHVTDTVTRLDRLLDRGSVADAMDGGDCNETQKNVPTEIRRYGPVAYCTGPGNGFRAFAPVRVTGAFAGKFKPVNYDDVVATCQMWWAHLGKRESEVTFDPKIDGGYHRDRPINPDVVARGFDQLSEWKRYVVATQNATKTMPRITQFYYRLGFDSAAFFNTINQL